MLYAATVDVMMGRDGRYTVEQWMASHIGRDDQALTQRLLRLLKLDLVEPHLEMFTEADLQNIIEEELS